MVSPNLRACHLTMRSASISCRSSIVAGWAFRFAIDACISRRSLKRSTLYLPKAPCRGEAQAEQFDDQLLQAFEVCVRYLKRITSRR